MGEYDWAEEERVVTSSACAPACRMVAVIGWHDTDDESDGHPENVMVEPVVAIRTSITRVYGKRFRRADGPPSDCLTERELIRNGWIFISQHEKTEPLIVSVQDGEISTPEDIYDAASIRVVACPWPPGEDDQQLSDVKAEMVASAARRAAYRREVEAEESRP